MRQNNPARLIAGFERPIRGTVHLQQQHVAGEGRWVTPEHRGVGMVFQDYALFPISQPGKTPVWSRLGDDRAAPIGC